MSEISSQLQAASDLVRQAFESIHQSSFAGTDIANANLEVDVIAAGELSSAEGTQYLLVLVTPWTLNGLVLPGTGLPETLDIAGHRRPVTELEIAEVGRYAQVNLVPDVSKYTNHSQARTIAESMVPVFVEAVTAALP